MPPFFGRKQNDEAREGKLPAAVRLRRQLTASYRDVEECSTTRFSAEPPGTPLVPQQQLNNSMTSSQVHPGVGVVTPPPNQSFMDHRSASMVMRASNSMAASPSTHEFDEETLRREQRHHEAVHALNSDGFLLHSFSELIQDMPTGVVPQRSGLSSTTQSDLAREPTKVPSGVAVVDTISIAPPRTVLAGSDTEREPLGWALLLSDGRCRVRLYEAVRNSLQPTTGSMQGNMDGLATPMRQPLAVSRGGRDTNEGSFVSPDGAMLGATFQSAASAVTSGSDGQRDPLTAQTTPHLPAWEFDVELPSSFVGQADAKLHYAGCGMLFFTHRGCEGLVFFDLLEVMALPAGSGPRVNDPAGSKQVFSAVTEQIVELIRDSSASPQASPRGVKQSSAARKGTNNLRIQSITVTPKHDGTGVTVSAYSEPATRKNIVIVNFYRQQLSYPCTPQTNPANSGTFGSSPITPPSVPPQQGTRPPPGALHKSGSVRDQIHIEVVMHEHVKLLQVGNGSTVVHTPAIHLESLDYEALLAPSDTFNQYPILARAGNASRGGETTWLRLDQEHGSGSAITTVGHAKFALVGTENGFVGLVDLSTASGLTNEQISAKGLKFQNGVPKAFCSAVRVFDKNSAVNRITAATEEGNVYHVTGDGASAMLVLSGELFTTLVAEDRKRELLDGKNPPGMRVMAKRTQPKNRSSTEQHALLTPPIDTTGMVSRGSSSFLLAYPSSLTADEKSASICSVSVLPMLKWSAIAQRQPKPGLGRERDPAESLSQSFVSLANGSTATHPTRSTGPLDITPGGVSNMSTISDLPQTNAGYAINGTPGMTSGGGGRGLGQASDFPKSPDLRPQPPGTSPPQLAATPVSPQPQPQVGFFGRARRTITGVFSKKSSAREGSRDDRSDAASDRVPSGSLPNSGRPESDCGDTPRTTGGGSYNEASGRPPSLNIGQLQNDASDYYDVLPDAICSYADGYARPLPEMPLEMKVTTLDPRLRSLLVVFTQLPRADGKAPVVLVLQDSVLHGQLTAMVPMRTSLAS